jgi:spore coat protein A
MSGSRGGLAPAEDRWKDSVQAPAGAVTRIIATSDKAGTWVWHCHILSHEDHEMMRRFEVV